MGGSLFGYVRVSTKEQNLDRQLLAMQAAGVAPKMIYQDKISGKNFERPEYQRLLKKIKAGDTLVVKSIDRLGRNYEEILEQWRLCGTNRAGVHKTEAGGRDCSSKSQR